MSQFQVDATGNLVRSNGSFVRISGREEVSQHTGVRLKLFRGEVIFDLSLGTNYVGDSAILSKGNILNDTNGELNRVIRGTPGIVSVDRLTSSLEGRQLSVSWGATGSLVDAATRIPLHDTVTIDL